MAADQEVAYGAHGWTARPCWPRSTCCPAGAWSPGWGQDRRPPIWVASWGSPAGLRRVFVRPLGDEVRQLERFRERVAALI